MNYSTSSADRPCRGGAAGAAGAGGGAAGEARKDGHGSGEDGGGALLPPGLLEWYRNYYRRFLDRLYITRGAEDFPVAGRAESILPDLPVYRIEDRDEIPAEHRNARTLLLTLPKGRTVDRCPGSRGHLCCNYLTIDQYMGCPLGCSYCIMKGYLNFEPLVAYVDPSPSIEAVLDLARNNPDRPLRIGTGEVGDSLFLDPLLGLAEPVVRALSGLSNVSFELKTKTDHVGHLLDIPQKGGAVLAFSLNPQFLIDREEGYAVDLERRLDAARRAVEAGYRLAFHFDPIIAEPGWQEGYDGVVRRLFELPADRVAWISLGTFRYIPALKKRMDDRPYLYSEFVPCRDGKYRYPQKMRIEIYRFLTERLAPWLAGGRASTRFPSPAGGEQSAGGQSAGGEQSAGGQSAGGQSAGGQAASGQAASGRAAGDMPLAGQPEQNGELPIYFCMESPAVWKAVFGRLPGREGYLRDIFQHARGGGRLSRRSPDAGQGA
ncbi:MAG: radical SAM protein [Spirochaetales bacterium]|nr:radical SAM protein [Spirochaetales bacterium]